MANPVGQESPRIPSPFHSVAPTLWRNGSFWLDIIFGSYFEEDFQKISEAITKEGARCMKLLSTKGLDSVCVRIFTDTVSLGKCLAPLYEQFPGLFPLIARQIQQLSPRHIK